MSPASRYLIAATALFTALNICVKYLPHIPASELVFFRGVISLFLCWHYARKKKVPILGNNKKVLVLRGLFGTTSLFILFYCLQRIPLAMATVLSNLAPLFTVLIAHYLLRERAIWLNWVLLFFAFVGVVLVKGWDPSIPWGLALFGVGGAVAAAGAYTCVRVLRTTDHPLVVIFYFPLVSIPLMAIPMFLQWVTPSWRDLWIMVLLGILTQVAQYYMTLAYQLEKASKVMVYNYAGVVWAMIFGALLFQEVFELPQYAGVLLIFVAIVASSYFERRQKTQA
jgi:drug/metabolite transporter (DMT)-like permease